MTVDDGESVDKNRSVVVVSLGVLPDDVVVSEDETSLSVVTAFVISVTVVDNVVVTVDVSSVTGVVEVVSVKGMRVD